MLVVYDDNGEIYFAGSGRPIPEGIPFMEIVVPKNKVLIKIDTSSIPHQPIFEDIPKNETELLREAYNQHQSDIDYLMLLLE